MPPFPTEGVCLLQASLCRGWAVKINQASRRGLIVACLGLAPTTSKAGWLDNKVSRRANFAQTRDLQRCACMLAGLGRTATARSNTTTAFCFAFASKLTQPLRGLVATSNQQAGRLNSLLILVLAGWAEPTAVSRSRWQGSPDCNTKFLCVEAATAGQSTPSVRLPGRDVDGLG